jgi:hypothetical protein
MARGAVSGCRVMAWDMSIPDTAPSGAAGGVLRKSCPRSRNADGAAHSLQAFITLFSAKA